MLKAAAGLGLSGGAGRRAALLCLGLAAANAGLWALAGAVFGAHPALLGAALLAYGFGLRHAVDADHIAAIDNVTRKLAQTGQRPIGVGFFFSLGHASVVFGLTAIIAATSLAARNWLAPLAGWGGGLGTLVSAFFLLTAAAANALILASLIALRRRKRAGGETAAAELHSLLARRGLLARLFRRLFAAIGQSWHMYPVGFLFGLGFDTATEIGLLGLSAATSTHGLPGWSLMLFPALFAAGMALVDTVESLLMLVAYGWALVQPERKLAYNIAVTALSVAVAAGIGGVELLGLLQNRLGLSGWLWRPVAAFSHGNACGLLGTAITALFIGGWVAAAMLYRRRRAALTPARGNI
jgi:high-affinity nickel-transport protein